MVSLSGDPVLGFSKSRLGMQRAAYVWWRFSFRARSCDSGGPYPGHILSHQAAFCLTRRRSVGQRASHQSGCVPSFPIRIEWGKGESFLL